MWQIENKTPFLAQGLFSRDLKGGEVWIVIIKGTFQIYSTGKVLLASQQENIHSAPVYHGDPKSTSLRYESDCVFRKINTDILLNGNAHAGRKVPFLDTALKVGLVTKRIRVFGDRYWKKTFSGLTASKPEPFEVQPIQYEYAFGGKDRMPNGEEEWDIRNPVGLGFFCTSKNAAESKLPNLEYPNQLITSWRQRPSPAGFAPILASWSPRRELAGTFDDEWQKTQSPLLPVDFQEAFFQSSPKDQQVPGFLKGGEKVTLLNLSAHGFLEFRIPRVHLFLKTKFKKICLDHKPVIHTVMVEPDQKRIILTWHSMVPCHHHEQSLEGTQITFKPSIHRKNHWNEI